MNRRAFLATTASAAAAPARIPAKTVVLTLDDAVKSHRTFAGPLIKEFGFHATFFVTHRWMEDTGHFMSWAEIAELHQMGFEIGNHTWTHSGLSTPRAAATLEGELALVDYELNRVKVPKPVSFAWPGNQFGPEAVGVLEKWGIEFARRGVTPERPYGEIAVASAFRPEAHHRLLIPTTGDAYPKWTLEHFTRVLQEAQAGKAVVLQFHGIPDVAHPWVNTPAIQFRQYMEHLKAGGYRVIAMRDLKEFIDDSTPVRDPLYSTRFPAPDGPLPLADEVTSTQAKLSIWLPILKRHAYSEKEVEQVAGKLVDISAIQADSGRILPYPGGRHFRIGFQEGAINPLRGTKASVFLPWLQEDYLVIDIPEAIFAGRELLFLAHTHIPTLWNQRNQVIRNVDWQRTAEGLRSSWRLPDGIEFGAVVEAKDERIHLELRLTNHSPKPLRNLRAQVCVGLKGSREFRDQSNGNKRFDPRVASVRSADGKRQIAIEWTHVARTWGNPACPCLHADPSLPDCAPGETVRASGLLTFGPAATA